MTTKVPILSLVGHTPVTVRFEEGTKWDFLKIERIDEEVILCFTEHGELSANAKELVEVLPAKQTPTPLTDECRYNEWAISSLHAEISGIVKEARKARANHTIQGHHCELRAAIDSICDREPPLLSRIREVSKHFQDSDIRKMEKLELERAALLTLVERMGELTDGNIGPVRADARALLAQLSGSAPACVSTASEDRA